MKTRISIPWIRRPNKELGSTGERVSFPGFRPAHCEYSTDGGPRFRQRKAMGGFALAENMIALGVIAIFTAASLVSVTKFNHFAASARLRTLALATAQQRIDEVLVTGWSVRPGQTRPAVLAAGTVTENNLPLNNDATMTLATGGSEYSDADLEVRATRTTSVTDITARQLRATVTVAYSFRGRPYQVSLSTLRTSDDF